jgi:hypothetical protein
MPKTVAILFLLGLVAILPAQAQTVAPSPSRTAARHQGLPGNQFSTEQEATAHCPGDAIVWVNLGGSKAYHTSGDKYYGKTKRGAYMCQKEADQAGFHAVGHRSGRASAKSSSRRPPQ